MSMHHVMLQACRCRVHRKIADLRLAASKMTGPIWRAFEAKMMLKYSWWESPDGGSCLSSGLAYGGAGLAERRTGIMCLGAQSAAVAGNAGKSEPQVAEALGSS